MKQKGSILIFTTWILLLLTLLSVSVGLRSRLEIGLSKFHNQYANNQYSVHSVVNLAAYFLDLDEDPTNDWKRDLWYGTPARFQKFDLSKEFTLQITDEESKFNLNAFTPTSAAILTNFFQVLKDNNIKLETDPKELIGSIMGWIGRPTMEGKSSVGFKNKGAPFESVDELLLIQHMTPNDFKILKPFFTVYGQDRFGRPMLVNINTAHPWILKAIILSLNGGDLEKTEFLNKIELYRTGDPNDPVAHPPLPFTQTDLAAGVMIQKLALPNSIEMTNMVNQFLVLFATTNSQFFSVRVETTKKGYYYPRSVEAILGVRQPVLVKVTNGNFNSQQRLNNVLNGYPYEILYWNEGV